MAHAASTQQLVEAEIRRQGGTPPPSFLLPTTAPAAIKVEQNGAPPATGVVMHASKPDEAVKTEPMQVSLSTPAIWMATV